MIEAIGLLITILLVINFVALFSFLLMKLTIAGITQRLSVEPERLSALSTYLDDHIFTQHKSRPYPDGSCAKITGGQFSCVNGCE